MGTSNSSYALTSGCATWGTLLGPITQRSLDRNQAPLCCSLDWLIVLTFLDVVQIILRDYRYACQPDDQVPLAQWLERWSYEP